jgi:hypothetical protein
MTGKSSSKDPTKPALTLVSDDIYHLNRQSETPAERIRRLQVEAKILAREQIEILERAMNGLAAQARDISFGGDAYPPGIREMAGQGREHGSGDGAYLAADYVRCRRSKVGSSRGLRLSK